MASTKVKEDEKGIYILVGGYIARPGPVRGYDHAYDMSDGGLKAGDSVKARGVNQSPLNKITTESGRLLTWHSDEESTIELHAKRASARKNRM